MPPASATVPAPGPSSEAAAIQRKSGMSRYNLMPKPVKIVFLGSTVFAVLLFIFYYMGIPFFGTVLSGTSYYYLLFAVLGFNVFMGVGVSHYSRKQAPPWYDYILAFMLLGLLVYFLLNSERIAMRMWTPPPDAFTMILAVVFGLLALEAGRRIGGWGYTAVLLVSIIYPLFAGYMPGVLWGFQQTIGEIFADFAFGANGLLGLPAMMLGNLILGFYVFAGLMMGLGGGDFFMKLASSILGHVRGGPAKVSVLSSAFFGMLSGSIVANIVGTGSFTIPAMKRMGYKPEYAGAVEACASSGGDTMPPVMGGMVFMAAIIANVDYATIMIAAFLPTFLYFFGLLIQVDGQAAKMGLRGLPRAECPKILPVLKEGWTFLVCIFFLTFGLLYMRWGMITPLYAVALMVLLSFTSKKTRLTWRKVEEGLVHTAGLINFGIAVFLSMGFILVGLFKTGVAASITTWVVSLGAGNMYIVLFIAMAFNLVMGMVGLQRAAYLFLSVTMAPAVAQMADVPLILIHLFIIFYAGYGGLTPPVALHAFIAASMAGADPMKTAYASLKLGSVLAFIPFFFVLQPALAMQGTPFDIVYHLLLAMIGIFFVASSLEGFLAGLGKLPMWERVVGGLGGFLIAFPEVSTTLVGGGMAVLVVIVHLVHKRLIAKVPAT